MNAVTVVDEGFHGLSGQCRSPVAEGVKYFLSLNSAGRKKKPCIMSQRPTKF